MANKARGAVWFHEEDVALCISYVNIGEDGDRATNQDSATLWRRIAEVYATLKPVNGMARSGGSCEARWRRIRPACNRWRNALTRAKAAMSSGQNSTDLELQARSIYRTMSGGKEFNLFHCWEILENTLKFAEPITLEEHAPMPTSSRNDVGESSDPSVSLGHVRPMGKKSLKEKKHKHEASEAIAAEMKRSNDLLEAEQRRQLRLEEDEKRRREHEADLALISKDVSQFPSSTREIWEGEIALAIQRIQARQNEQRTTSGSSQEPTPQFPPDWSDGYIPHID